MPTRQAENGISKKEKNPKTKQDLFVYRNRALLRLQEVLPDGFKLLLQVRRVSRKEMVPGL